MLHGPAAELGEDRASSKKTKLGVILFLFYLSLYVVFVVIGLFFTELMSLKVIFGLNLAVSYGIGLIILAMVMGFIYNLVCSKYEDKMNKEVTQ